MSLNSTLDQDFATAVFDCNLEAMKDFSQQAVKMGSPVDPFVVMLPSTVMGIGGTEPCHCHPIIYCIPERYAFLLSADLYPGPLHLIFKFLINLIALQELKPLYTLELRRLLSFWLNECLNMPNQESKEAVRCLLSEGADTPVLSIRLPIQALMAASDCGADFSGLLFAPEEEGFVDVESSLAWATSDANIIF